MTDKFPQLTDEELSLRLAKALWPERSVYKSQGGRYYWRMKPGSGGTLLSLCSWEGMGLVDTKFPCPPYSVNFVKRDNMWMCYIAPDYNKRIAEGFASTAPRAYVIAALRAVEAIHGKA